MDPIMWDPFRYKLGGRLLNGRHEEFIDRYGGTDEGTYTTTRDRATYAILKEVEAGRGSPHGGAWLDFRHVPETDLREAFGPVIDRLLANGIDLTRTPVEVSPIAHYHMGGVRVGASLESSVAGLFAAGEAVGGANGANRLSGNAITEALVFGESAGRGAAEAAASRNGHAVAGTLWRALASDAVRALERDGPRAGRSDARTPAAVQAELQRVMVEQAGPLRDAARLQGALERIREWQRELPCVAVAAGGPFNLDRLDWIELRGMLLVAETIVLSALRRTESRGAHQREDCPATDRTWDANQVASLVNGAIHLRTEPLVRLSAEELQ
jgi:succinate dehydrogenase/fumarate reductase flavoprotein subunit